MSQHYSQFLLNTYAGTPYFESQLPPNYPLHRVLQKSRMFRQLPPNLKRLSQLAKVWAVRHGAGMSTIDTWYSASGDELDPNTGRKLTDAEINTEWNTFHPDPSLASFSVTDIPIPRGGFADPQTWEVPATAAVSSVDIPGPKQLSRDILSHGKAAALKAYGISESPSVGDGEDVNVAQARFAYRAVAVLSSPYVAKLSKRKQALIKEALATPTDMFYDDLGGEAQDIFDRAEASLQLVS